MRHSLQQRIADMARAMVQHPLTVDEELERAVPAVAARPVPHCAVDHSSAVTDSQAHDRFASQYS